MDDVRHFLPFLIPFTAIVMGLGVGMLSIWLDYRKKMQILELHHKERMLAIERGMELPPLPAELFSSGRHREMGSSALSLQRGLQLLLLGLALGVALLINHGPGVAAWALLPVALGLAYLFAARINDKNGARVGSGASTFQSGTKHPPST